MSFDLLKEEINKFELPNRIQFYSVCDQKVFPIIPHTTGVITTVVCYLICYLERDYKFAAVQPIEFTDWVVNNEKYGKTFIELKLKAALVQLLADINDRSTRLVSMDGGLLGRESEHPIRMSESLSQTGQ